MRSEARERVSVRRACVVGVVVVDCVCICGLRVWRLSSVERVVALLFFCFSSDPQLSRRRCPSRWMNGSLTHRPARA